MKKYKKKRKIKKKIILLVILLLICSFTYIMINNNNIFSNTKINKLTMFLASNTNEVVLYTYNKEEDNLEGSIKVVRGKKIITTDKYLEYNEKKYFPITIENTEYYVNEENLTENIKEIVKEKTMYVRTPTTVLKDSNTGEILSLADKGEELEISDYDELDDKGNVITYQIKKDNDYGYIYGKYLVTNKEDSLKTYNEKYDEIYKNINNTYGGGEASKLDYYPKEEPNFENNKMPESVYALYLNCGSSTINNVDAYIDFTKDTKINAFVVDIKDNESPAYPAKTFETLSPTNYNYAINSYDSYKEAINKLKNAGFYVIGRITTFKDSYYVKDNPSAAITSKYNGTPYLHNASYWPSAYNREVWYYNVSLAKEAVKEFGFNEINFDYVRFPDRMQSVENSVDLHNTYNEDKTQAIQRFVRYATDELHKLNVYVSIDVFGETTNGTYTTAYGQYWPAISNVADVISGMPYPDHFSAGYYGISKPWNNPYLLMKTWASFAKDRQQETPTPATARTWIQAYDVMKYVDSNGINYGAKEIEQEVRGLYEGGLDGGYITWLSNSNIEKYKIQKKAFQIDYLKEYKQ